MALCGHVPLPSNTTNHQLFTGPHSHHLVLPWQSEIQTCTLSSNLTMTAGKHCSLQRLLALLGNTIQQSMAMPTHIGKCMAMQLLPVLNIWVSHQMMMVMMQ